VHVEDTDEDGIAANFSVITADGHSLLLAAATAQDAAAWEQEIRYSIQACTRQPDDTSASFSRKRVRQEGDSFASARDSMDSARDDGASGGRQDHKKTEGSGSDAQGLPVLLVLEVVGGPLAGERFEIGGEGIEIIRLLTCFTSC
jgi:hypothetical protein